MEHIQSDEQVPHCSLILDLAETHPPLSNESDPSLNQATPTGTLKKGINKLASLFSFADTGSTKTPARLNSEIADVKESEVEFASLEFLPHFDLHLHRGRHTDPVGQCAFWPKKILHAPLRSLLKRAVGHPVCTPRGFYATVLEDGTPLHISFGSSSHIIVNGASGEIIAGQAISSEGLLIFGPEICHNLHGKRSWLPMHKDMCEDPTCAGSSGKYVVLDYGGTCEAITLEVIHEPCSRRAALLDGRRLLRQHFATTATGCDAMPVSGDEMSGSIGSGDNLFPATFLFGSLDTVLISARTGTSVSLSLTQLTVGGVNDNVVFVRELPHSKEMASSTEGHIGVGCDEAHIGVYHLDCNKNLLMELVRDPCLNRQQVFDGAMLGSHTPAPLDVGLGGKANAGFGFDEWVSIVDRHGTVCDVVYSGDEFGSQWPASRIISAQKAYTANSFSLPEFALSSANLWAGAQPGQPMYGLQFSNPINVEHAYPRTEEERKSMGTLEDPMIGYVIGGTNVFAGGLALYDNDGHLVGGLGTSGDSACADHFIAWRLRHWLGLDYVPDGMSKNHDDNIVFGTAAWQHPHCGNTTAETAAKATLHPTSKAGKETEDWQTDQAKPWLHLSKAETPEWAATFLDRFWALITSRTEFE